MRICLSVGHSELISPDVFFQYGVTNVLKLQTSSFKIIIFCVVHLLCFLFFMGLLLYTCRMFFACLLYLLFIFLTLFLVCESFFLLFILKHNLLCGDSCFPPTLDFILKWFILCVVLFCVPLPCFLVFPILIYDVLSCLVLFS